MLEFDAPSHVYRFNGREVPSVTTIIRSALGDPFERVAARVLEFARQRGTAVHRACELDDAGQLDESTVDERIWPYVDAWRTFRRQFKFHVLFAERPLYLDRYGIAGTPDVAIMLPSEDIAVVDRKTGLPGAAAALQTAAYAELITDVYATRKPPRRFSLRMRPTGRYTFDEYTSPRDWPDFLACLTVHRLKERISA